MAVGGGSEKGLPRAWASSRRLFHAAQASLASVRPLAMPSSRNLLSRSSSFRSNHFFMPWASTIIALPVSVVTGGVDGGMVAGAGDFGQGGVGSGGWDGRFANRPYGEGEGGMGCRVRAGQGSGRWVPARRLREDTPRGGGWIPAPTTTVGRGGGEGGDGSPPPPSRGQAIREDTGGVGVGKGRGRAIWPAPFGVSFGLEVTRLGDDDPRLVGVDPVGCASFNHVLSPARSTCAAVSLALWKASPACLPGSRIRRPPGHRCWRSSRWWRCRFRLTLGCLRHRSGSSPRYRYVRRGPFDVCRCLPGRH